MTLDPRNYVPPKRTPCTPMDLAQAIETAYGGDGRVTPGLIRVLIAHAVLEGGRDIQTGQVLTSTFCHAVGNIKVGAKWTGKYTCFRLNEYLTRNNTRTLVWFSPGFEEIDGTRDTVGAPRPGTECAVPPGHDQTQMRAFDSLLDAVQKKAEFFRDERFGQAMECARNGDAEGFVRGIHKARYFTAPVDPYVRGVTGLAKSYAQVADQTAFTPAILGVREENLIDACIRECSRSVHHVELIPLEVDWQQLNRDRTRDVLEGNDE